MRNSAVLQSAAGDSNHRPLKRAPNHQTFAPSSDRTPVALRCLWIEPCFLRMVPDVHYSLQPNVIVKPRLRPARVALAGGVIAVGVGLYVWFGCSSTNGFA